MMNLKIITQWQETELYDSGIREFIIPWNGISIPRQGDEFHVYNYINDVDIKDVFDYKGKEYNVFEWIQNKLQWTVGSACWSNSDSRSLVTIQVYG